MLSKEDVDNKYSNPQREDKNDLLSHLNAFILGFPSDLIS